MRKSILRLLAASALAVLFAGPAFAGSACTKIQSGALVDSTGNVIKVGYDQWGYNYQAHTFNGFYENYSRPPVPVTSGTERLMMKWSDDWLANVDCNGDGKLDRGLVKGVPDPSNISKGWLTNHMEGEYLGSDGELHHYTYFVKIVYVGPPPPIPADDKWAGDRIWGSYAIIQENQSDPFGEYGGRIKFRSKVTPPGLGLF
jgi:hypothetical protein